jgi:hypothetical protein
MLWMNSMNVLMKDVMNEFNERIHEECYVMLWTFKAHSKKRTFEIMKTTWKAGISMSVQKSFQKVFNFFQ